MTTTTEHTTGERSAAVGSAGHTAAALVEAEAWTAHNYHPLPVVIADADGAWVTDVDGRRYLDCLAGYSALNFGHRHPDLIAAARAARRLSAADEKLLAQLGL